MKWRRCCGVEGYILSNLRRKEGSEEMVCSKLRKKRNYFSKKTQTISINSAMFFQLGKLLLPFKTQLIQKENALPFNVNFHTMQFDQDFGPTICISLGNFKFQTIFWPRRSPKTEKRFRMVFRIPKVSLKIRQDLWFWNSLKAAWWPQCKKFHRSDFISNDNFGILNIKAKKVLPFFRFFMVKL